MKVFVVSGLTDYEESNVLGAFSSSDRAQSFIDWHKASQRKGSCKRGNAHPFDDYGLEEFEIDVPGLK